MTHKSMHHHARPRRALGSVVVLMAASASAMAQGGLPPVPFPPENPYSEAKRILGKLLFFEEQLSSDNTMACATCHVMENGGTDPRLGVNPGPDGVLGTADDLSTSPGVIRMDAAENYFPDPVFGLNPQLTGRSANPAIMAMYAEDLFWDGRARGEFIDPQTGEVVIASGGALESQAVGPVLSDIEMAHPERDWDEVTEKLRTAVPWALATDHTPDAAAVLAAQPSYPDLFADAFGDPAITAARIGMAIATYERTLLPDQTPWDAFMDGDTSAMTTQQVQGWNIFQASRCIQCHVPPQFTDNQFRNIGLRPNNEDIGREAVTGNPADRGKMKVSTLRNTGLKRSLMHTGQFTDIQQIFAFYAGAGSPGNPNRDPILPAPIPPNQIPPVFDFIANALTDPRVANEEFPFDRPTLHRQGPSNPAIGGGATAGSGGLPPRVIAVTPPNIGNAGFRLGLDRALGGSTARVVMSKSPPSGGAVPQDVVSDPIPVEGMGIGNGYATFHWPIPADASRDGEVWFMQWFVNDPAAAGGVARSQAVQVRLFCGGWCPPEDNCPADVAEPFGVLDLADIQAFIAAFLAGEPLADVASPQGVFDLADLQTYVASFVAGCP